MKLMCLVIHFSIGVLTVTAQSATRNAASASYEDVIVAVHGGRDSKGVTFSRDASDGDIIQIPPGDATWGDGITGGLGTLSVTKNIQIVGAGEGKTRISENLPRAKSPPLLTVTLTHDAPSELAYSFRLSGITFRSAAETFRRNGDKPFIKIKGESSYVHLPSAANPAPYVLGCVSKVRVDHCMFDSMKGMSLIVENVIGVADHCTFDVAAGYSNAAKVFHTNWTPALLPDNRGRMKAVATHGFGSWADDSFWGTDKFWFFEDSTFNGGRNVMDAEQGARCVVRHCTLNDNTGFASHGAEGRPEVGVKQLEIYDNYLNLKPGKMGQIRGGSILFFNNMSVGGTTSAPSFQIYRKFLTMKDWGAADGTNRYDDNAGGPAIYTGIVTATSDGYSDITDTNQANFDKIHVNDGTLYSVNNLDEQLPTRTAFSEPGWKYFHSAVKAVDGQKIMLLFIKGGGPKGSINYHSAIWSPGNHYEIRKVNATYAQIGRGKMALIQSVARKGGGHDTYTWPNPSNTKATNPMAGYPLDPAYSWNNSDVTKGYLRFDSDSNPQLIEGRDFVDLPERTTTTHTVGHNPTHEYTGASDSYPNIGPTPAATPYKPYTYPHPLQHAGSKTP